MGKRVNNDTVGGQSRRHGLFSWQSQSAPVSSSSPSGKTSRPPSSRTQTRINTPPQRQWPGIKNLPHLKRERYFRSEKDVLSNFYMTNLRVWDMIFKSIEHGYQWRKAMHVGLSNTAWRIMNAQTVRDAKYIANDELNTEGTNWHTVKYDVMYALLIFKANQCPEFVDALLQSGDEMLIEDTNDKYWARGTTGHGSNILGELLMLVRDALHSSSSSLQAYCPPSNGSNFTLLQLWRG